MATLKTPSVPVKPTLITKKLRQLNLSSITTNNEVSNNDNGSKATQESPKNDDDIVEKKVTLTSKEPLKILDLLESSVNNNQLDKDLIFEVHNYLKLNGSYLDDGNLKESLDHHFNIIRNLSRNVILDAVSRAKLLELIELRARNWSIDEQGAKYHEEKITQLDNSAVNRNAQDNQSIESGLFTSLSSPAISATVSPQLPNFNTHLPHSQQSSLSSNEVSKNPDQFSEPVKVPGRNSIKEEFTIRNDGSSPKSGSYVHQISTITFGDQSLVKSLNTVEPHTLSKSTSQPLLLPGVSAANLPYIQAVYFGDELMIVSSSSVDLAKEARDVLNRHFFQKLAKHSCSTQRQRNFSESDGQRSENNAFMCKKASSALSFGWSNPANNDHNANMRLNMDSHGSYESQSPISPPNTATFITYTKNQGNVARSPPKGSAVSGRTSLRFLHAHQESFPLSAEADAKANRLVYQREFLLNCSHSELSKSPPYSYNKLKKDFPAIIREVHFKTARQFDWS